MAIICLANSNRPVLYYSRRQGHSEKASIQRGERGHGLIGGRVRNNHSDVEFFARLLHFRVD